MIAAIGFRAKTGRAIGVVLAGGTDAPTFVWRGEVHLVDDSIPLETGPYHEVMDLPWSDAIQAVQPLLRAIERVSNAALKNVVTEMRTRGIRIRGAAIVGSSPRPLDRIGNPHIRAHAAEGILFRRVLEEAAAKCRLRCGAFSEDEIKAEMSTAPSSEEMLKQIGRAAGAPWRVDERLAASAAWIALGRALA